jgi:proprotein convertase subtilisin/kexin type 2
MNHSGRVVLSILIYALILSACGGGGNGSSMTQPPAMPTGVSARAGDSSNTISWASTSNADNYNIYWSTTAGVNKSTGTKIAHANNPQTHTGLTNGTTYFYVVTTLNGTTESDVSSEVSATPAPATGADPLYPDQWHLNNTGQKGFNNVPGKAGEDIDAEPAWASYKGDGVRIAIVDDGLEIGHEDLAANIAPTGLSYNYITGSSDPTNDPSDQASGHGTSVAGIAASRDNNGLGGRGVAPRANLVGYNLLQSTTTSHEADAMTRGSPNVDVSSNSWGAPDDTGVLYPSSSAWRTAIDSGIANGRNGLGTNYIWAAGNGAPVDDSNYDGQANYKGVIAVTSVNDQGKESSYAEPGANIWISAPGGEYCDTHAITTTDRTGTAGDNSYNNAIYGLTPYDYANRSYTKCMNATSAATPQIAGVVALMLEANPNLTWRDVRLILAQSARQNDPTDAGWTTGSAPPHYHFNHKYGFGVADAGSAVLLASTWTSLVGAQLSYTTTLVSPNKAIPDNNSTGVSSSINVTGSGISSIEFVEITFSAANHPYAADLAITLTSPAGTVSQLAETHTCFNDSGQSLATCPVPYSGWVFGSARHLGEAADGIWTLTVKDGAPSDTGTFQSWKLKFYGR